MYPLYKTTVPQFRTRGVDIMIKNQQEISIRSLGDSALVIQLGEGINPITHDKILNLIHKIETNPFHGFIEAVPCYNSVTVFYNPVTVHFSNQQSDELSSFQKVSDYIKDYTKTMEENATFEHRIVEIPVIYGGDFGPDLNDVADANKLTPEEVIEIHSQNEYMVYMIGFAPGFPFLGGMNEIIATPRKETPRLSIPAGSVGIAGKQTGIYPVETPGGWQIIGRTPSDLFLPEKSPPTLLQAGDKIRFVPITAEQYATHKEGES